MSLPLLPSRNRHLQCQLSQSKPMLRRSLLPSRKKQFRDNLISLSLNPNPNLNLNLNRLANSLQFSNRHNHRCSNLFLSPSPSLSLWFVRVGPLVA